MKFIRLTLKYHKIKKSRWKWEHRFYEDLYSEIYDKLHKKNPNALHENIDKTLKKTAATLPKLGIWSTQDQTYLPVKLYAFSPNSHLKKN